jgi:hypothetical protein
VEEWIALCESAGNTTECAAAANALPPLDGDDAWHWCSMDAFVATQNEGDAGCALDETIEACHYEAGGEDDPWEIHDIAGCGTTRGEPAYLERGGERYTAFLPWAAGGNAVQACEYADDGTSAVAECECLCGGRSDPAFVCESGSYATCEDPASGLTWMRASVPAEGEVSLVTVDCEGVNWGDNIAWRPPTIDDLRTLVRGCAQSEAGGTCAVSESCAEPSCADAGCGACDPIPYPDRDCYVPRELGWPCELYWSTTTTSGGEYWGIDFTTGAIVLSEGAGNGENHGALTCVGEPEI